MSHVDKNTHMLPANPTPHLTFFIFSRESAHLIRQNYPRFLWLIYRNTYLGLKEIFGNQLCLM